MSKVYKGYELLKAIADGEIKDGTKFKIKGLENVYKYEFGTFISEETGEELDDILSTEGIARAVFELIEDETIEIEEIKHEELEILQEILGKCDLWKGNEEYILKVINENNTRLLKAILKVSKENETLTKAVKQVNKEIKELKENG